MQYKYVVNKHDVTYCLFHQVLPNLYTDYPASVSIPHYVLQKFRNIGDKKMNK